MDKTGADYNYCIKSIEKHLNTVPVLLQLPLGKEKAFIGVVDLINMTMLTWNNTRSMNDDGKTYECKMLTESDACYADAFNARLGLIEKLAQVDDKLAEVLLDKYDLKYELVDDNILLESHLRKLCLNSIVTPVLCGSSFKNIAVQPLLDSIIKYLPNPSERQFEFQRFYNDDLCALCFKTMHEHRGLNKKFSSDQSRPNGDDILSFVRIYSGELMSKSQVYNATKDVKERVDKLFIPYADQMVSVKELGCGNIAVISGLANVIFQDNIFGALLDILSI
jgi:elongation factor G